MCVSSISHVFWPYKRLLVSDFEVVRFPKPAKNDVQKQIQHIAHLSGYLL